MRSSRSDGSIWRIVAEVSWQPGACSVASRRCKSSQYRCHLFGLRLGWHHNPPPPFRHGPSAMPHPRDLAYERRAYGTALLFERITTHSKALSSGTRPRRAPRCQVEPTLTGRRRRPASMHVATRCLKIIDRVLSGVFRSRALCGRRWS